MLKRVLIISCGVLLLMFFTHPYVISVAKFRLSRISQFFYSDEERLNTSSDESDIEEGPLVFATITNAVSLLSALIDVRSEYAMRRFCLDLPKSKECPVSDVFSLSNMLEMKLLGREVIKDHVSEMLSRDNVKRRDETMMVRLVIKNTYNEVCGSGIVSFKRWGVEITEPVPIFYSRERELSPFSTNETALLAIISSHYKAILYEEVEKLLIEQAMSDGNQYSKEIEALRKRWAQEAAKKN